MTEDYQQISCSYHDHLEAAAVTGRSCDLTYLSPSDVSTTVTGRITDVFARDGAEFVRTDADVEIRLDRIIALDGVAFQREA